MRTLLPRHFKLIGYAIPVLILATLIVTRLVEPTLIKGNDTIANASLLASAFGLLIVILSRNKVEGPEVNKRRLRAAGQTVFFILMYLIYYAFFPSDGNLSKYPGGVIFFMEAIYLGYFHFHKRYNWLSKLRF